jgi:alpha-glucosidase (family GH31 glycosyl hydrolase)
MIGDALLATLLYGNDYETAQKRDVYLPEGTWIDYDTGQRYIVEKRFLLIWICNFVGFLSKTR